MVKTLFILMPWLLMGVSQAGGQDKITAAPLTNDIKIVSERLAEDYLSGPVNSVEVTGILSSLQPDGSWPGIDYVTVGNNFPAGNHLKNIRSLAVAFAKQGSDFYRDEKLKQKIIKAYDFYLSRKPASLNWWFNEIGAPQDYMAGLILLKGHMKAEDLVRYSSYLRDLTDNPGHRGMNRIWVSAITINKGCIENDYSLVRKGFQSVASTLVIAGEQGIEGIKIDNSFHQHRPQLYSGGYGMGFAESTATLMALSASTSFHSAFSEEKKKIFSDLLLYGHQLFSFRDAVDFGTIGRNISRPDAIHSITPSTLDKMGIIDPQQASAFAEWKSHLQGAPFPKRFTGNRYFWKSDIMTHHGTDYYLSAKVISTRTNGTEMLNGENLKGYNLPLGATNIMKTGTEYKNIFPVWDWTRVPGTTAVMNPSAAVLPWYLFGNNEFAGGVSNGKIGAIAYEHSYNGVQAKKAYFFVDDIMLCLGTGISAIRTQQVVTSVNQCYSGGPVTTGSANGPETRLNDTLKTFKAGTMQWFYHDGVGYVFPQGGNITLKNARQEGSWKSINTTGSSEKLGEMVFSLWLNHGTVPKEETYCYVVRPEKSLEEFRNTLKTNHFKVYQNNRKVQAAGFGQRYFIIFYAAGTTELENGLCISADVPVILLLEQEDKGYRFSLADPMHREKEVNITVNKIMQGEAATHENSTTRINFKFPQDDYTGSTVSNFYEK